MKLRRYQRVSYGAAEFGLAGAELMLQLYLLEFYISVVGLSPALAGVALALAVLWDAISDPMMGAICDHTRTRFGRFIPYMAGGGVLFVFGFVALFHPPVGIGAAGAFFYLLGNYLIVNTAMTLIGVPHMAMAAEVTRNPEEHTALFGWRLIFGTFGLFAGILAPLVYGATLFSQSSDQGFPASNRGGGAILLAIMFTLFLVVTLVAMAPLQLRGQKSGPRQAQARFVKASGPSAGSGALGKGSGAFGTFWRESRHLFANRWFVPLFLSFLFVAAARAMNATLALPYYKVSLALEESVVQTHILSVFTLFIVLSVAFWQWLARRFGKKWPAFAGMLVLGTLTSVAYPLFPVGQIWGPVIVAMLGGVAVGAIILFESLVAGVARLGSSNADNEGEGLAFGYWRMGQKIMRSLGLALTGVLLWWIGYEEGLTQQSEQTARRLAWVFGPGVGSLFIMAALVFSRMPAIPKD